jgi:hypothetical protein
MDFYKQVVEHYKKDKWKSNPFDGMLEIKNKYPAQLVPFLELCIAEIPEGGAFVDAAFSFLSKEEFRKIIEISFENSDQNGWSDITVSVIDYASLQFPELLQPHLGQLIKTRDSSYYDRWVWRNAGDSEIEMLCDLINTGNLGAVHDAWDCLANIRNEKAIKKASDTFEVACERKEIGFKIFAQECGFELEGDKVRELFFRDVHHIVFNSEYVSEQDSHYEKSVNYSALSKKNHPTWLAGKTESIVSSFGGQIKAKCGCCGKYLHKLVVIPENFIENKTPITLVTCLSCLGWEEQTLFYKHDELGMPNAINIRKELCTPEFPSTPLRETEVFIVRTPIRWSFQDWGLSNSRENLNRIGGYPTWVQGAEYPSCPCCKRTMKFATQLDSGLLTEEGDEWLWGSGGICYLFWCNDCRVSSSLWQCT